MKQFILTVPPDAGGKIHLSGKDYHYLARVRRLNPGAVFKARLPGGGEALIRVLAVDENRLTGECLQNQPPPDDLILPRLHLFQALPKGAKMDLIVRQAAEGGITGIAPFISAYSVPRLTNPEERLERWRRIIREARQQSGSGVPTSVDAPRTVEGLLAYWEELRLDHPLSAGLLLHQDPEPSSSPIELRTFHGYLYNNPDLVAMAIGPEGGFSSEEIARFKRAGFKPLVMGNTVLRVETAALYAAAAIRIILWERVSWMLKPL